MHFKRTETHATWDRELEERVGEAIGAEGRMQGANVVGSVCINWPTIFSPSSTRWPRSFTCWSMRPRKSMTPSAR